MSKVELLRTIVDWREEMVATGKWLVAIVSALILGVIAPPSSEAQSWKNSTALLNGDSPGAFWLPSKGVPLKGMLVCLHGFGLNAGSFDAFGKAMAARGYATFAPDIRGFGYWRESGAHPKLELNLAVQDVCKIAKSLKTGHPDVPLFVLGESMGGAIGLTAAAEEPDSMDGLIAVVPSSERFGHKKASAVVGVRYLLGKNKEFDVTSKVIDRAASSEELKKMWLADSRNRLHVSPSELVHFNKFMKTAMTRARDITSTPVLLVQGCLDNLTKPGATIKLYNSLRSTDKRLLMVGNAEHLIFQKGQFNNQTVEMLTAWLKEHPKHN